MVKPLTHDLTGPYYFRPKRIGSQREKFLLENISSIIAGKIQKITVKVNCILNEYHLLSSLPHHDNPSLFTGAALFSLETFSEDLFYISCIIKVT